MKTIAAAILVMAVFPAAAYGNAGVFAGTGGTIQLSRSDQVQLEIRDASLLRGGEGRNREASLI
jgi:hypothetical protein